MIKMSKSEDGYYAPASLCDLRADGSIRNFKGCGGCYAGSKERGLPCEYVNLDGTTECVIANMMNEYARLTGQAYDNKKEENEVMMEGMFNGMFGRIDHGMCRLSVNGDIAVKTSKGYKYYNMKSGNLVNCSSFVFDIGEEMFFVIPTNKAEIGDILLIGGKPKCVIKVEKKVLTVIDYENSEIRQALPERHVFMGNTYFYGKIVSFFGKTNFIKGKGGMNKIMKYMMAMEMMKGMSGSDPGTGAMGNMFGGSGNGGGNMMQSLFMMNMMGNMFGGDGDSSGNMLEDMFGFDFGDEDDEDSEAEDGEEIAEEE